MFLSWKHIMPFMCIVQTHFYYLLTNILFIIHVKTYIPTLAWRNDLNTQIRKGYVISYQYVVMQRCKSILKIQQNFLICFLLFATSSFVEKCTRIGSEHDMNNFVQIFVFPNWKSNAHFIQFGSNHYIFVYHVLKRKALTSFMKEKDLLGK